MSQKMRPELSQRNKYWISKHRHYELKHFCLQYPVWKRAYSDMDDSNLGLSKIENRSGRSGISDSTGELATKRAYYGERIRMVEQVAYECDPILKDYILLGVTEGLSYTYLRSYLKIPCGRDTYYENYRKFFWLLNNKRL